MVYSPNIQLVYNEKAVEDLLEGNCKDFLGLTFVARQFRTPVGVLDVVARHPSYTNVFFVIEIKKERLDPAALAQVLRYTKWMNSERSKDGERLFLPMLIGEHLSSELIHICEYFESDEVFDAGKLTRIYYRLFAFDALKGVSFEWTNKDQEAFDLTREKRHCHAGRLSDDLDYYRWKCEKLEAAAAPPEDAPSLMLVKSDGGA